MEKTLKTLGALIAQSLRWLPSYFALCWTLIAHPIQGPQRAAGDLWGKKEPAWGYVFIGCVLLQVLNIFVLSCRTENSWSCDARIDDVLANAARLAFTKSNVLMQIAFSALIQTVLSCLFVRLVIWLIGRRGEGATRAQNALYVSLGWAIPYLGLATLILTLSPSPALLFVGPFAFATVALFVGGPLATVIGKQTRQGDLGHAKWLSQAPEFVGGILTIIYLVGIVYLAQTASRVGTRAFLPDVLPYVVVEGTTCRVDLAQKRLYVLGTLKNYDRRTRYVDPSHLRLQAPTQIGGEKWATVAVGMATTKEVLAPSGLIPLAPLGDKLFEVSLPTQSCTGQMDGPLCAMTRTPAQLERCRVVPSPDRASGARYWQFWPEREYVDMARSRSSE